MTTTLDAPIGTERPHDGPMFEYLVVPLQRAKGMKKDAPWIPGRPKRVRRGRLGGRRPDTEGR